MPDTTATERSSPEAPLSTPQASEASMRVAAAAYPAQRVSWSRREGSSVEAIAGDIDAIIAKQQATPTITRSAHMRTGVEVHFSPLRILVDVGHEEWADFTDVYRNEAVA